MKLRLHWAEKYEVVREYPSFEIDSNDFPELELEMLQVHNAGSAPERMQALDALEYKMHQTQPEGGETIFEMFGPYGHDKFEQSKVHTVTDEVGGFVLTEEEE
tara:strand:- start:185 stop:493 length:309 start_codon:yes stop_codon:yes gene_type:complete